MPEIVQEIGSYAGIASVVGVALLAALYFSQARDVKRLREWAGRAPERADQQLPAVPGRVVAQPQPKAAPSASAAPPVPAQAVATGARPAAATPAAASAAASSAAAAPPAPPKPGAPATPAPAVPAKPGAPVPAGANSGASAPPKPGVAPPGQNSSAPARTGGPATPAAKRPAGAPPVPAGGGTPKGPNAPGGQPSQETAIIPPPREDPWYRRLAASPRYLVLVVAGVLILGGAVAFGVAQLAKDDGGAPTPAGAPADNEQSQSGDSDDEEATKPKKGAPIEPSSVTVAVLNGTTVGGLAAALGDQVGAAGFQVGTVANFGPNQQLAESIVEYTKGHEREAAAVGRKLGIGQRERASAESQELAGDATVIVIAGADKAP